MTIMLGLHIYQYIDSGFQIYPLIRIITYAITIPLLVFVGGKAIPYTLFPFAIALSQTIDFTNYTPFVLVYVCCKMKRKYKVPMVVIYAISIAIVCIRHGKSVSHFLLHVCGCITFFMILEVFNYVMKRQTKLNLTDEEEYILYEITYNNRQLKEFPKWKENTVSKKLKACCNKNNCKNPKELKELYKRGINSKYV